MLWGRPARIYDKYSNLMKDNQENFKEKFKQALISTVKVISDDYKKVLANKDKNSTYKNLELFEFDSLNNKDDFIRLRAETDSEALKKKFSDREIYQKNLPSNPSCKSLYELSEKIRYEMLGSKMLKGISKNLSENYLKKIDLKKKIQLKSKEDSNITEAFELYMLKNFFNLELNPISKKLLNLWEKDFNKLNNDIKFLKENLENQKKYNSKFSEILESMDIFDSKDNVSL